MAPIAATEIDAPATAAMTSIMAATGYKSSLSTLPAQRFLAAPPWAAVLPVTLSGSFGATGFVIDASQCSFRLDRHYQGTPLDLLGASFSVI